MSEAPKTNMSESCVLTKNSDKEQAVLHGKIEDLRIEFENDVKNGKRKSRSSSLEGSRKKGILTSVRLSGGNVSEGNQYVLDEQKNVSAADDAGEKAAVRVELTKKENTITLIAAIVIIALLVFIAKPVLDLIKMHLGTGILSDFIRWILDKTVFWYF